MFRADEPRRVVHVVAAAVIDARGRVLIAQRPPGKHLAGGWEFPGGKLEPGEERAAGLARELHEELGITVTAAPRPLTRVQHAYPTRDILLDMWVVKRYRGEPHGHEGQVLRWVSQEELATVDLLPADAPIVAALRLPERLRETASQYYGIGDLSSLGASAAGAGAAAARGSRLRGVVCRSLDEGVAAVSAGADFLVMREVLADGDVASLCERVAVPVFARGIGLERAWALGASGVTMSGALKQHH